MQRNNLPLFFMLIAGTIVSIVMVFNHYALFDMLLRLLLTLLLFFLLGNVLKWCLNYFDKQNRKAQEEERLAMEEKAKQALEEAEKETSAENSEEK